MPVTTSDLRAAAAICRATLGPVAEGDWTPPAHGLAWDRRATLDHVCDCLAFYAHDLAARIRTTEGEARDGAARATPAELIRTVETLAELLCVVADGSPAEVRAFHPWGMADAEGFLAMGAVEILLHTWDVATAFGRPLVPAHRAEALAGALLPRLFPWAPAGSSAMDALLACTGRAEAAGFEAVGSGWAWHAAPVPEWDGTIPRDDGGDTPMPTDAPPAGPRPTWDAPPVAPGDLREVAGWFRATLDPALDRDWSIPAGQLGMSCRDVLDHTVGGLAYYVGQLATRAPVRRTPLRARDATTGVADLIELTETAALALAAVAEAAPPDARAYHALGSADAEAFLAMACVEVLVHAWDVAQGLGLSLEPPAGVAPRLLRRLYRLAPTGHDAWETLLYASGRAPLGDLPHVRDGAWGWHVPPLGEWDGAPAPTWEGLP